MREMRISTDCDGAFRLPARYALTQLFLVLGVRVRFVRDGAEVHYGSTPVDGAFWLPADPTAQAALLEKQAAVLRPQDAEAWGRPFLSLFPVAVEYPCPSDLVAAAFFFFSLHEEWTSEERDQFDRFTSAASLLGARGEQARPVLAEFAAVVRAGLASQGIALPDDARYGDRRAAAVMTHDIDYLSKFTPGLIFREVIKNFLFNRRHVSAGDRAQRLREYLAYWKRERDPYVRSVVNMLETERERDIEATWLFKAGGTDKRDVTYSLESTRARWLLDTLRESGHDIGLHPSFHAHRDRAMLEREKTRLQRAAGIDLQSVRQHYLRFRYPETLRNQSDAGFTVDSTLGFAEQEGWRNGSAHPFLPFDLERKEVLPIWELPLLVMDGTLAQYRGLAPGEALGRIAELLDIAAGVSGTAVLLFHNTSFDAHDFPGWGGVFEETSSILSDGRFLTRGMPETVEAWTASAGYASTGEVMKVINSEPV
ncbi:MAG: hypothetical protein C0600_01455 [Ignavibacteria bacterium]|nr:MAG: hypothetical protein C0600_01455 [Ignavibacteria bacterium]